MVFNGAAGFRPRRRGVERDAITTTQPLQWGRGLSPTETRGQAIETSRRLCSSMGPRAFAHGDIGVVERPARNGHVFNGAAGFRPRRPPSGKPGSSSRPIFNGAAGFRPRRPHPPLLPQQTSGHLQWGRGLSPTETRKRIPFRAPEPDLQWGRGLSPTETRCERKKAKFHLRSSMGPRAFAHGDPQATIACSSQSEFLQWGRGLSPTETCQESLPDTVNQISSMGPRAFAHGDPSKNRPHHRPLKLFNGAAGFRPRRRLSGC